MPNVLKTEYEFTLPRGYVDADGNLHKTGTMRLATALDEIAPLRDPRVLENRAYLAVLLLSRVVVRLGPVTAVTPALIERLFTADLAYLEDLYLRLNSSDNVLIGAICPACSTSFHLQVAPLSG